MRIYLADLTHDTVGLATEVFPLNVGYVGAYCKKSFGDEVEIRLFKYIPRLESAILSDPPDILAVSNYPWCHNIGLAMLELAKQRRPETLRVMGGPNFPHEAPAQGDFLAARPTIDAYVYLDGEIGFSNLVAFVRDCGGLQRARRELRRRAIEGVVQLKDERTLVAPPVAKRIRNLDDVPSPYLSGLLDEFFDGRLSPIMQTNRGCPFRCTFCADGTDLVNKVNEFSLERVKAEIAYIGEHAPKNLHFMYISDLNFGMYKRDSEICEEIVRSRARHGFPSYTITTTGKNSKMRVIRAIERLEGTLDLTMAVQSMSQGVLENIKRSNIKLDDFLALQPAIRKASLTTTSELILGLPGETRASHLESIGHLLDLEIDRVEIHTLMLLKGSEMDTAEQRAKWGFRTKFRVLPRDFTKLQSGRNVVEIEEVVIENNALSWDDYLYCRKIALLVTLVGNPGVRPLLHYLVQRSFRVIDLLCRMLDAIEASPAEGAGAWAPGDVAKLVREFGRETADELWESPEDIEAFFRDDANFQMLVSGRMGANLIQTYRARTFANCLSEIVDCAFAHTRAMVGERSDASDLVPDLEEIERFVRCRIHNLFGVDRLVTAPDAELSHDVESWLKDPELRPLSAFRWSRPRRVRFVLSQEQYREVEDLFDQLGHTDLGRGKALIRMNVNTIWRRCAPADGEPTAAMSANPPMTRLDRIAASNGPYS